MPCWRLACTISSVPGKRRADLLLVERGLAESRAQAQRLIMAGQVRAGGEIIHKPSDLVETSISLEVCGGPRFVSRGGEKLAAALAAFQPAVAGAVCADVGASTGGFTDCLLQHGAAKVYAIDVGKGQLHWRLRKDPRVVVMEGVNARYLAGLPESVQIVTVDAAFISLRLLLPRIVSWLEPHAEVIALVKPQFEVGRQSVGKGGVVRDAGLHREAVVSVAQAARKLALGPVGLIRSPITGPKGNIEFLLHLRLGDPGIDMKELIGDIFPPAEE